MIGENCDNPDTYYVMQKNEYTVSLATRGTHDWQGEKTSFTFDDGTTATILRVHLPAEEPRRQSHLPARHTIKIRMGYRTNYGAKG